MVKVEITQNFELRGWFPKLSYNLTASVLEKYSSNKTVQSSGLYSLRYDDTGQDPLRFGAIFNGEQYAELDYFERMGEESKGFVSINLFGTDEDKLNLIGADIKKGLEGITNKNA
jgi:hypothetical protein